MDKLIKLIRIYSNSLKISDEMVYLHYAILIKT